MELYVKSALGLEHLAEQVSKEALAGFNRELRDGLNLGGGEYFKFSNGLSAMLLVCNDSDHLEVFVESRAEFPYCFYVRKGLVEGLDRLSKALSNAGSVCELAEEI